MDFKVAFMKKFNYFFEVAIKCSKLNFQQKKNCKKFKTMILNSFQIGKYEY